MEECIRAYHGAPVIATIANTVSCGSKGCERVLQQFQFDDDDDDDGKGCKNETLFS